MKPAAGANAMESRHRSPAGLTRFPRLWSTSFNLMNQRCAKPSLPIAVEGVGPAPGFRIMRPIAHAGDGA